MSDRLGRGKEGLRPNERARERRRLLERAQWLREHATDAERQLWSHLRCCQLDGYKFRRQVLLVGYVADFVCFQARLVIEVDGGQHAEPEQREWDRRRTEWAAPKFCTRSYESTVWVMGNKLNSAVCCWSEGSAATVGAPGMAQ